MQRITMTRALWLIAFTPVRSFLFKPLFSEAVLRYDDSISFSFVQKNLGYKSVRFILFQYATSRLFLDHCTIQKSHRDVGY